SKWQNVEEPINLNRLLPQLTFTFVSLYNHFCKKTHTNWIKEIKVQQWNWDYSHKEAIQVDLEWENDEESSVESNQEEQAESGSSSIQEEASTDNEMPHIRSEGGISSVENSPTQRRVDTQNPEGEGRIRKQSVWLKDYETGEGLSDEETHLAMFADQDTYLSFPLPNQDPTTFEDAVKSEKWRHAMDQEIQAIERNNTWELTTLPYGGKSIRVKWVYKTKLNENGEVDKYKARLVAKGCSQEYGVDYAEVFAPVARLETIRLILALAAQKTWTVYQLDVKSAFLHGEIKEEVFVDQPPGYEVKGQESKVYRLKKALYGLKQAPRAWYSRIEAYFIREGFTKCPYEHTLFIKFGAGGKILIVCLYVDDLIYTGNDKEMFEVFKKSMMTEFDMTDLGKMRYFLGIEVEQRTDGIFIGQRKYAQEMLRKFNMDQCNAVHNPIVPGIKLTKDDEGTEVDGTIYRQMVGSLMYLTTTRPDLMFAVSLISRYMKRPTESHLASARRVLRYVKGTINFGIFYRKGGNKELIGFTDSDYAGDLDDRKSTSGYVFLMSSGAVSWCSTKQPVVTLSTTEAEFIAAASSACQVVWLRRILEKLSQVQHSPTVVYCDNTSAIRLSRNPVMHGRSKHIDVRFHFLRELVNDGVVELVQCSTQEQVADILTKPLKLDAFLKLRQLLGVCEYP
ncbi:retrovirus-related pol polyprotein from transposon TNT 1-94, partial [Tanacetum coccineum]